MASSLLDARRVSWELKHHVSMDSTTPMIPSAHQVKLELAIKGSTNALPELPDSIKGQFQVFHYAVLNY